ncbi:MAG: MurR/RpiR family transcriptional regulator [Atopostipes sp.]|nr:MurR/RpiR family transcriptional regulator [Atopostipes sp.]
MLFLDYTPDLTPLEKDIYRYIAAHLDQVIYMRIRDLAEKTHTSPTTILRFCEKFECEGFSEFRIKLKIHFENQDKKTLEETDETALIDFIHRANQPLYQENIENAIDLLKNKELILFLGSGSSNILSEYGSLYFSSIFKIALRIEDPINLPLDYISEELSEKICIIVLSVSGETNEIVKALHHPNLVNCSVISITNSAKSTIAEFSDVNIPYYISKEYNKSADITTQIPALYTIELLAKEARKHLQKQT